MIDTASWAAFLDDVTAAQRGHEVVLELLAPDLGDQHEAEGLPLASVGYDRGDDVVIVALSSKDDPSEIVLRHMVNAPRSIAATPPLPGQVKAIRVENDDGVTLVELRPHEALSS
jgi:hypothetical protein